MEEKEPVSRVDSSICLNSSTDGDSGLTKYVSVEPTNNPYGECVVKPKWISDG